MSFKIGDSVQVLDENLTGVVCSVSKQTICINTSDGFQLDFNPNQLIKTPSVETIEVNDFFARFNDNILWDKRIMLALKRPL
jgi:hypothetical protein